MATHFEPQECVIFVHATKIGTHENKTIHSISIWKYYSDDLLIRTHLFPVDISGLTSFPDYWNAHQCIKGNRFPHFLSGLARFPDYRSPD